MQPHLAMDLHVKSQASRWDGSGYVNDAVTSPTIDGGHPQDAFDNETAPNGNRVNLGAWGNTAQASRSSTVTLVLGGLTYDTYLLFGVPAIPTDGSPDAVLGDDFPGLEGENIWGEWVRLLRWDTAQEDYVYYEEDLGTPGQPPDLLPGRGYWLIQWWSLIGNNGHNNQPIPRYRPTPFLTSSFSTRSTLRRRLNAYLESLPCPTQFGGHGQLHAADGIDVVLLCRRRSWCHSGFLRYHLLRCLLGPRGLFRCHHDLSGWGESVL